MPDIVWRPIPGGTVEIERHGTFTVQPFEMAAYAITASQCLAFVQARDGYDNKRWWRDLNREEPHGEWGRLPANHPVTHVSWYDATAFCRWLAARLGMDVRLPDEQEWQWAAQSAQKGFVYPWGKDWREGHANTREARVSQTTAVGMFPQGDSRQQVCDLAGNVWEWCRNVYENPERPEPGGEQSRVVRGGSWNFNQGHARARPTAATSSRSIAASISGFVR
jgi:formylglycine-generating enzyme required for sulfatase activity